ncbi:hypothetical protein GOP47_0011174 [Adiantum capillus-veneris]|uniref:Uncharacterized protein n=1 Tax=Adiantum capillus-veneris TaxID=13818 RepID=A0A9D4USF2_ADICA|nr:hypothetical protein GOP47_0011174 [Adiantum capillus-veneris]
MELRTFFLITIATLGFLSGLLSFIAEGKKLAESDITRLASGECVHSRSPALGLGLAAAISLLIAQIISNALGGCICCESGVKDPSGKTTPIAVAISCLTFSWVTFSIAFLLLVAGASINDKRGESDDNLSTGCYVLKSGVFTGAAFAAMTTAILGVAYNLQVFALRKTMAATVPGAVDGASTSSSMEFNSIQDYTGQVEKARVLDHKTAYPRSAVNPHRDIRSMEMASPHTEESLAADEHTRMMPANRKISGVKPSKQTRKPLLQQSDPSGPIVGEHYYDSHRASQAASASYHMGNIDSGGAHWNYEQDGSRPSYRR